MESYSKIISSICSKIHTGLVDFSEPRSEASMPTQASSEFITNKQQGDWAEDLLFRAINENSDAIVAVRYGKSDDLVAGDEGFETFFHDYQNELDTIGKRPDLLLFHKADYNEALGLDISRHTSAEIHEYVKKAIAGIEVRSSAFLIDKYMQEANRIIEYHTNLALSLKQTILSDYQDLLKEKRPELITILNQLDSTSVRSIDFRLTSWKSSERLEQLSSCLCKLKSSLKVIQKRNSLSITPKVEDLKVVKKWIDTYDVPHFYVQVFFDKVYGISFKNILELISQPDLEGEKYYIEADSKNQNKTTIKIPSQDGTCLVTKSLTEPNHHSVRKELNKGRLLFYVKFEGGEACLDKRAFDTLFGCNL